MTDITQLRKAINDLKERVNVLVENQGKQGKITINVILLNPYKVEVVWDYIGDPRTSFIIERMLYTNPNIWSTVATVPFADRSYIDNTVEAIHFYTYRVRYV